MFDVLSRRCAHRFFETLNERGFAEVAGCSKRLHRVGSTRIAVNRCEQRPQPRIPQRAEHAAEPPFLGFAPQHFDKYQFGEPIPGNRVVGVYRNDFAVRAVRLFPAAMIEAPIRFYVTEDSDGTATLSWKTPSLVFAPSVDEAGPDLAAMAAELDAIFEAIDVPPSERRRPMYRDYRWTDEGRDRFIEFLRTKERKLSDEARTLRKARHAEKRDKARTLRVDQEKYARFYDAVADLFADALRTERAIVDAGKPLGGLAAKWAPSPKAAHDVHTGIVDGIVRRLYPAKTHFDAGQGTEEQYLSFMTDRYRREYLSPLRRYAGVPESIIGRNEWHLIDNKRMASRCRLLFGAMFRKHDQERYDAFIQEAKEAVKRGAKPQIAAGAVLPHELT